MNQGIPLLSIFVFVLANSKPPMLSVWSALWQAGLWLPSMTSVLNYQWVWNLKFGCHKKMGWKIMTQVWREKGWEQFSLKCLKSWIIYQTHTECHSAKFCEGQGTKNPGAQKLRGIPWKCCSNEKAVNLEILTLWKLEQIHKRYRERNEFLQELVYLGSSLHLDVDTREDSSVSVTTTFLILIRGWSLCWSREDNPGLYMVFHF